MATFDVASCLLDLSTPPKVLDEQKCEVREQAIFNLKRANTHVITLHHDS
jgi:hypothetical protein